MNYAENHLPTSFGKLGHETVLLTTKLQIYGRWKKYDQIYEIDLRLLAPLFILFFVEVWPIKSTGSFFSTWNATFFWLIVSMIFNSQYKKTK